MELESKSMKAQLRKADKFNPTSVLIRGENEIAANTIVIKNLDDSSQNEYNLTIGLKQSRREYNASISNAYMW